MLFLQRRYAVGRIAAIFAAVIVAAGCATQSAASRSNATAASAGSTPSGEAQVARASATEDSLSAVKAEVDRLTVELDKLSIELDAAAKSKDVKLTNLAARLDALGARVESIQKGEADISRLNAMVEQLESELQRAQSAQSAPPVSVTPALPATPTRDSRYWPQGYYPGDPLPPRTVYLTFDDGPSDFTIQILDILKEEGVHATFFMNSYDKDNPFHADTGKNLLFRYADALKRIVDEGHAIGNHTYSHRDMAELSPSQIVFQLDTLKRQLAEVLGDRMPCIHLIRPPFGSPWYSDSSTDDARKKVGGVLTDRGLVMLWTIGWDSSDSFDWAKGEWYTVSSTRYRPGTSSYDSKMDRETARILKTADGNASGIVLMHDTHPTTRDVLKSLIEELKRRGYSFGTLEDYCRWRWGPDVFKRFDASREAVTR
jgi:peptidoglycan/xylan/chitin deacetylase (PgdA/CDA1 family)/chaperonin cofactor prefoldin